MKSIIIHQKKESSLRRFHPWVFSGAIKQQDSSLEDGDTVALYGEKGGFLASGHYQSGSSIAVRILSFRESPLDQAFWNQKMVEALEVRRQLGLSGQEQTNCFRLIHGEGDGLPGLIIDIYDHTAVVQCHSIGMQRSLDFITRALQQAFGESLQAIYDKSAETLPTQVADSYQNSYLFGEAHPTTVKEYGHLFKIDWEGGQKTGFFLDQRENRRLLTHYVAGKIVLNSFCYTGGFSVYALQAGAAEVHSVDASRKAITLAEENVLLNHFITRHEAICDDVLHFLRHTTATYDVMVVDPPAFAKSLAKRHQAVQGYKRLNALALEKIKPGGILFTFSCSQVVDEALFYHTIVAAALEVGRPIRVLHRLSQPADHPVNIFHPEGAYLKGLVLWVG
ncbi:MAG TPA: class I SAM-dependent rRNA methyltransferase [Saprospiraceae bacterium]|nr:class I SAM-dependent rRNA methyltransferase [Saprospiraceae bacterium]HMQ84696.1 class I SAM-dependent rRNA methyltransferase [Saprospiraceae bacterium]